MNNPELLRNHRCIQNKEELGLRFGYSKQSYNISHVQNFSVVPPREILFVEQIEFGLV